MGFPQSDQVGDFGVFEPLESLMDQYVVYQKIGNAIKKNPQAKKEQYIDGWNGTKIKQHDAGCSENNEEPIVFFKH